MHSIGPEIFSFATMKMVVFGLDLTAFQLTTTHYPESQLTYLTTEEEEREDQLIQIQELDDQRVVRKAEHIHSPKGRARFDEKGVNERASTKVLI